MNRSDSTLAVFDFGKTNAKMLVYSMDGDVVFTTRSAPRWTSTPPVTELDDTALWTWVQTSLQRAASEFATDRVMIATHGCATALIKNNHLAFPILDYECPVPTEVETDFRAVEPDFSETGSPDLPNGLNYAIQIFWRQRNWPDRFAVVEQILPYPQFWVWKMTGKAVSEISFLGCHSHLWSPASMDYSSLVDRQGWRGKMPDLLRAGAPVGTFDLQTGKGETRSLTIHNGVHDSNAALYFYRSLGYSSFTLISTGTWVIIFNTDAPLSRLDQTRDMLANVSVDRVPVVTSRFMGGREFDLISQQARISITLADIEAAIASGQMALPSFAAGGPFPGARGELIGPAPKNESERAAVASLYLACMTRLSLEMIGSDNRIIIDGGLANNSVYPVLVASLCPDQTVLMNAGAEGTAAGAAALAFESFATSPFADPCIQREAQAVQGLQAYYQRWKQTVGARQAG